MHPYSETCIVGSDQAAMTVDGEDVVSGRGDIAVVGPETPHRFTAIGNERLNKVYIHASDCFIIEWLRN